MICQRIAGLYKKIIDKAMKTQDMVLPVPKTPKYGTENLQFRAKYWSMAHRDPGPRHSDQTVPGEGKPAFQA